MKQARILLVAAAAFLVAAFVGCSMADVSNVGVEKTDNRTKTTATFDGTIKNLSDFDTLVSTNAGNNSARTIQPTSEIDSSNYDYYLYGISNTGSVFPPLATVAWSTTASTPETGGKLTFDASGNFKITIEPGIYDFTLFAVKKTSPDVAVGDITSATIVSSAALVGYSTVDLTKDNGVIEFTLSSDGLSGAGVVNFDVYLANKIVDDPDTLVTADMWALGDYKASMHLLDFVTGDPINYVGGGAIETATASWTAHKTVNSKTSFGDSTKKVAAGTYTFMVIFYDADDKEVGSWSDTLVVYPQRTTDSNAFIPKKLQDPPEPVTYLTAAYVKGSENNPRIGFYKVHFQWDNKPVNERYYEIQIADITGSTTGLLADETAWTAVSAANRPIYSERVDATEGCVSFLSSEERYDGSLLANNEHATFYLKLGHQYQARIRAVNAIGKSAWVEVSITDGTAAVADPPVAADANTYKVTYTGNTVEYFVDRATTPAPIKCINRFGITYDLNGGKYATSATTATNKNLTRYYCQDNPASPSPVPLWDALPYYTGFTAPAMAGANPTDAELETRSNALVKRGATTFKAWVQDINNPSSTIVYQYNGDHIKGAHIKYPTTGTTVIKEDSAAGTTDGGYLGYSNYTVYADYSTGTMSGTIKKIVDDVKYKLAPEWFGYATAANTTATSFAATANTFTISKAAATSGANCTVTLSVNLPDDYYVYEVPGAADHSNDILIKYDSIRLEIKDNTNAILLTSEPSINDNGNDTTFTAFNIKKLENGVYSVMFTARKTSAGKTIIRSLPMALVITD